jgi:hypothetical protein
MFTNLCAPPRPLGGGAHVRLNRGPPQGSTGSGRRLGVSSNTSSQSMNATGEVISRVVSSSFILNLDEQRVAMRREHCRFLSDSVTDLDTCILPKMPGALRGRETWISWPAKVRGGRKASWHRPCSKTLMVQFRSSITHRG